MHVLVAFHDACLKRHGIFIAYHKYYFPLFVHDEFAYNLVITSLGLGLELNV